MRQDTRSAEKGNRQSSGAPRRLRADRRGGGFSPGRESRRRQRDVLCDVMLSASQCETWLTLDEIAKLTHYPQASISAQLRHLRKPQFGGFEVEKRQRFTGRLLRGEDYGTVWEYQLRRGVREVPGTKSRIRDGRQCVARSVERRAIPHGLKPLLFGRSIVGAEAPTP